MNKNKTKPERHLHNNGLDWVVNIEWIKLQIVKSHTDRALVREVDITRDLIVDESKSNYGETGYIFFALKGSPPKGCAIYYIPEFGDRSWLLIVDINGRAKKHNNIIIEDFESSEKKGAIK